MITCTCHGDGMLEIKCPFNARDRFLTERCKDPSFCLSMGEDGKTALKANHKYMYQMQAQMHVTLTLWYGHHRKFSPSGFCMILFSSIMPTSKWLNSLRLEYYRSSWGNGTQHHATLPQTVQVSNIYGQTISSV